jgi:hypothetical protein
MVYVFKKSQGKHYYILENGHYKTETANLKSARKRAVPYKQAGNIIEITKSIGVIERKGNLKMVS